jgi:hypothetical protein
MQAFTQMFAAIFVALGDASGTLPDAKRILSRALKDGVITDPMARAVIGACATADIADCVQGAPAERGRR